MLTPRKIRAITFLMERERWIRMRMEEGGCKICGTKVEFVQAFISVHDEAFPECTGPGQSVRVAVPFCPFCERSAPQETGCFHEELSLLVRVAKV